MQRDSSRSTTSYMQQGKPVHSEQHGAHLYWFSCSSRCSETPCQMEEARSTQHVASRVTPTYAPGPTVKTWKRPMVGLRIDGKGRKSGSATRACMSIVTQQARNFVRILRLYETGVKMQSMPGRSSTQQCWEMCCRNLFSHTCESTKEQSGNQHAVYL